MKSVDIIICVTVVACLSFSALAQDQFVGKWQARISPATGKHSITVNIVAKEGKIGGAVVLVSPPDGSEVEWPIVNSGISGRTLTFETGPETEKFIWKLNLKNGGREGLLHGSGRHMLIEERVVKKRQ
jgi:hypothetical protein